MCLLLSASIRRAPVLRRQGTQEKMNWGDLDWWGSDWHLFLDALLHRHLVWLRPGLLPLLFFLWRVHVRMALGDVIASMPLVKQGLCFTCRGGALASLATGVRQCKCVCVCQSIAVNVAPGRQSWQPQRCGGQAQHWPGRRFFAVLPSVLATPLASFIRVHLVASTC